MPRKPLRGTRRFAPRKARWRVDAMGQSAPQPCMDRSQSMIARTRGMSLINFALSHLFHSGPALRCSCGG